MSRLANVLIVDDNPERASSFSARIAQGGYFTRVALDERQALSALTEDRPDLVLLTFATPDQALGLVAGMKRSAASTNIPLLLVADIVSGDLAHSAYEAGADDVIATASDDVELFARLRPLVRLSTMLGELQHRAESARRFAVTAREWVSPPVGVNPSILIIGDCAEDVARQLPDATTTQVPTLFEAEDALVRTNFDAAILTFSNETPDILGFCSQVRNNPRLFNLPVLLMGGMGLDVADAYRRGATRVLTRPTDPKLLRSAVYSLVRRQQLRWAIRTALDDSLADATRDPVTGAYSRAFLEAHLTARINTAHQNERHLSVIFFSAPNIDSVRRQFGDDAAIHLTQQVRQWIGGLLRAEDLTASTRPNEFCCVLPDTPLHEAEVVMHRIAGVLAYTDFAVREVYQPVKVWVQVGATELSAGDDLGILLARARHHLD